MTRPMHVRFTSDRLEQRMVLRAKSGRIVVETDIRRDRKGRLRDYAKPGRPIISEEEQRHGR